MADYDKASGLGTLRIRDLGSVIEFWVKPYYSDFWWEDLDFNWTANGTTTAVQVDFSGNAWKKVGSRTVTISTTVTFRLLEATGTSSLGGPTTHAVSISRGTIPQAPDPVTFSSKTATSLVASFTDNGNGGHVIDSRQIGYAPNQPSGPTVIVASDGSTTISGLVAGQLYTFWARVHNSLGYSSWSSKSTVTMLRRPFPPSQPVLTLVEQTSLNIKATDGNNGGSAITARQFSYNTTNSHTGETVVDYDGDAPITGLSPGEKLYFWARTTNVYGTSDWSTGTQVTLIAGASVTDSGGVVRRAVPWVKVAGVWRVARPWGRLAGNWNKSAS